MSNKQIEAVMRNLALSIPLLLSCTYSIGQVDGSPNTYLNNYVQPSPNAASLGKYADIPVSYYTGVPEVNVPIYGLKDGGVQTNISLSYHAKGIRVAEVPSWVGLGWTLNAGGMILRTVRGAPDEGTRKPYSFGGPTSYYRDSGLKSMALLPYPVGGVMGGDPKQMIMQFYTIPGAASGGLDCEPDLYTFNFNGHAGKFVFDEQRTPRLLEDDNLKIFVSYNGSTLNFDYWVITTPDGLKYFFGENSMVEVTSPWSSLNGGDYQNQSVPSGWYLTKIVNPNTRDTLYFNYTPESYVYNDLGPESKLYNFLDQSKNISVQSICSNGDTRQNMAKTTVNSQRLSGIQSKNFNISFVALTDRTDIPTGYSYKRLDSIKVSVAGGQTLKQYAFGYSYFQSGYTTQCAWCNVQNPSWPIDSSDTRRLKLLTVKEISGDGSITKPPYVFQYQDTFQLPRRLSYDQDHWGYSNYASGNYNPYFTPAIELPGSGYCTSLADRSPKWPQMQSAVLIGIRDPLGAVTKFVFEPDSADNYYPGRMVGGLRVHSITVTDSLTGLQTVRRYVYGSGVLFKVPRYLTRLQNEFYNLPQLGALISGYNGYGQSNIIIGYLKQSQSAIPLQDAQGTNVGYPFVTEVFGNSGEGGSKVYNFQVSFVPRGSTRLSIYNYASVQTVNTIFGGTASFLIGNGQFNAIPPQSLQYYSGYQADSYYPLAPDQPDFLRGKLINEYTYDSAANLVSVVSNTYTQNIHENYQIRGFSAYPLPVISMVQPGGEFGSTPNYQNALTFYKIHTGIAHLTASVTKEYRDSKVMTVTHRYGFEDSLHTLQTSDSSTNSQGDSLISKTYYSWDYSPTATSDNIFGKMKARNLLLPVSTRVWKNNNLISGTITQFRDFATNGTDTFINPAKIYALETTTPLTPAQAGEGIAYTSPFTTLLPDSYFIEKADFNVNGTTGRIIEQKLASNKNQSLIWDNSAHLPIAVVDNGYFADIGYNSFESAETGNLSYTAASVVVDATAPTGSHAYNLASTNPITRASLTSSTPYVVSYWAKSGASVSVSGGTLSNQKTGTTLSGYTYNEVTVTGATSISINGTGYVDEVRVFPAVAMMSTYCYDGQLRLSAECGPNNLIRYYDYDSFNRLVDIRDLNGNIIKAFEYNYGRSSRTSQ